jgi:hypothetical protein
MVDRLGSASAQSMDSYTASGTQGKVFRGFDLCAFDRHWFGNLYAFDASHLRMASFVLNNLRVGSALRSDLVG